MAETVSQTRIDNPFAGRYYVNTSQAAANHLEPRVPWALICIHEEYGFDQCEIGLRAVSQNDAPSTLKGRIMVRFSDVTALTKDSFNGQLRAFRSMMSDQAEYIVNWVTKLDPEVRLVYIHCAAGVSRSAGMAAAFTKLADNDDSHIFRSYLPNMTVYRKIIEAGLDHLTPMNVPNDLLLMLDDKEASK